MGERSFGFFSARKSIQTCQQVSSPVTENTRLFMKIWSILDFIMKLIRSRFKIYFDKNIQTINYMEEDKIYCNNKLSYSDSLD